MDSIGFFVSVCFKVYPFYIIIFFISASCMTRLVSTIYFLTKIENEWIILYMQIWHVFSSHSTTEKMKIKRISNIHLCLHISQKKRSLSCRSFKTMAFASRSFIDLGITHITGRSASIRETEANLPALLIDELISRNIKKWIKVACKRTTKNAVDVLPQTERRMRIF